MKMGIVATVQYLNQYKPNVADVRQQVTYGQSMAYNVEGIAAVWDFLHVSPNNN